MSTIQINDPFTNEWTVFEEAVNKYDETNSITNYDCDDIIYKYDSGSGKFYRRVLIDDTVNVKWFGAKGDGFTNDTVAVQNACDVGKNIYFPAGTYILNIKINHFAKIFGAGSNFTILKPYHEALPVLILNPGNNSEWKYATVIERLTFEGNDKTGVGISMSKESTAYEIYDELKGNITFRNVDFRNFYRGLQCFFGNIGMDFYSVGLHHNKYGVYFLDNKFTPLNENGKPEFPMHAGNKYFYSGEFSNNEVAVYVHNITDGFGGIVFNNVIFEYNHVNTYIYTNNCFIPIAFYSCWNEHSGQFQYPGTINIETWDGITIGNKVIYSHTHIFEGENSFSNFYNCRITDFYINGDNIIVKAIDCYAETNYGVGATSSIVEGDNSFLLLYRPITIFGLPKGDNIITTDSFDYDRSRPINHDINFSQIRSAIITPRFNKIVNIKNKLISRTLENPEILTGSLPSITGTTVNDSQIFTDSNIFNIPFSGDNQFMRLESSIIHLTSNVKGWYVITFDIKINYGEPTLFLWEGYKYQIMMYKPNIKQKWQTILSYAYSQEQPCLEFYLDISASSNVELLLSAYQVLKFNSSQEAKSYIESKTFAL